MLSKAELDDIWENTPYGHFSRIIKTRKGTRKYIVTTEAREVVVIDREVQEVWAKDHASAQRLVHSTAVNAIQRRLGRDRWDPKTSYVTTAKET